VNFYLLYIYVSYYYGETDKLTSYSGRAEDTRHAYTVFVAKHKANNHLRDIQNQKDNIKMDFKDMGCEETDWIHLVGSN
jgi:hypothetical protein